MLWAAPGAVSIVWGTLLLFPWTRVLKLYSPYPAATTSSVLLFLQIKWFCTAFLPFSIKDTKYNMRRFCSYCFFPSFLFLSVLYFSAFLFSSGKTCSFIFSVTTRIQSKIAVSEQWMYSTQCLSYRPSLLHVLFLLQALYQSFKCNHIGKPVNLLSWTYKDSFLFLLS